MIIQSYGQRSPSLKRILITGGGNAGKTTLATKFSNNPERVLFISTDGNALRQGYMALNFEFPEKADDMLSQFKKAIDLAYNHRDSFDTLVIDLIEDFDERLQTLLIDKLSNFKTALQGWGEINKFYKYAHAHLMQKFEDKTIILLSRDEEEYDKDGEISGYKPALRKKLKNIILKDQDVEIRCYFEKGKRKFHIENLRFEEMSKKINEIIDKPVIFPGSKELMEKEIEDAKALLESVCEKGLDAVTETCRGFSKAINAKLKADAEFIQNIKQSATAYDKMREEINESETPFESNERLPWEASAAEMESA